MLLFSFITSTDTPTPNSRWPIIKKSQLPQIRSLLKAALFSFITLSTLYTPKILSLEYLNYNQSSANSGILDSIVENLGDDGFDWEITDVDGGALGAQSLLRRRAVKDQLPQAALVKGQDITRWAKLGFLRSVDDIAQSQKWDELLPSTISDALKHNDKYVATAVHVHRANWLWINRAALTKAGIKTPPKTWKAFISTAKKLQASNITPVLSSTEPWQNALIFEALVMSEAGPDYYQRLFRDHNIPKLKDPTMIGVFEKLASIRPFLNIQTYASSDEMVEAFMNGEGAFIFAADSIKATLNQQKMIAMEDYICAPIPETQTTYLFDIESLAMFKRLREDNSDAQFAMAELVMSEPMQIGLNIDKGAIPARLDLSPWGFDLCSVRSMREFRSSSKLGTIMPSIALGMTGIEQVRRHLFEALDQYIKDPELTPEEGWAKVSRSIRYGLYLLR